MLTKTDLTKLTIWKWRHQLIQIGFDRRTVDCLCSIKYMATRGIIGGPRDGARV